MADKVPRIVSLSPATNDFHMMDAFNTIVVITFLALVGLRQNSMAVDTPNMSIPSAVSSGPNNLHDADMTTSP